MLNVPARYWGTVAQRRGEELIACHHHGWSLDVRDPRVVRDREGRYFCDRECQEEWLQKGNDVDEGEEEEESKPAVPAAG